MPRRRGDELGEHRRIVGVRWGSALLATARATFDPARSWWRTTTGSVWARVDPGSGADRDHRPTRGAARRARDRQLLEHEQLHFDLDRGRRPNGSAAGSTSCKGACSDPDGEAALHEEVVKADRDLQQEQARFDAETGHGANGLVQRSVGGSDSTAARPASTSTSASTAAPAMKNTMTPRMALRLDPVDRLAASKNAGPAMAPNFSNVENSPKNSDERSRGIMLAKSDLPECLTASLHGRDQQREHVEIALGLHVVTHDGDQPCRQQGR